MLKGKSAEHEAQSMGQDEMQRPCPKPVWSIGVGCDEIERAKGSYSKGLYLVGGCGERMCLKGPLIE